jgi:hypothetical protein
MGDNTGLEVGVRKKRLAMVRFVVQSRDTFHS